MRKELSGGKRWLLVSVSCAAGLLILLITHLLFPQMSGSNPLSTGVLDPNIMAQTNQDISASNASPFNGHIPSLNWIVGRDCHNGIQAYLHSARTNPDAALVGTGWLDPTTGKLINGQSNNCAPGSLSMDAVVQLVHQHGGKAYLAITMETDGSSTSWTAAQQTAYIVKATQTPSYIDPILHEVQRAGYDGVIMDLEGADSSYPNIQQIFATYNQQVWRAVRSLHKLYGIALIHKVSDDDAYNSLNGFENWSLLAKSADFLEIMAVDQSYWTPGPCVSVAWLLQLLDYARQTMPEMLPHIIWEVPLYGDSWHLSNGQWVFDGIVDYQSAMNIIDQVNLGQIDQGQSRLQDPYQPHLVYTDSSGVTHSLWFMTTPSLQNIMRDFQQALRKQPGLAQSKLQFAVWWSTTEQPTNFWQKVDALY